MTDIVQVPTTAQVRSAMAATRTRALFDSRLGLTVTRAEQIALKEFDRWHAEELRQAKEQGARTERERIAHLAESIRSAHDIAECAAPVEGETGRQECIDQWISICEEPDTWLRELADDPEWLEANFFEVWEEGYEEGHGDNKTGTFTPNPYRSQP